MKLFDLIWVLGLAGAMAACNSGPPIQGCTNFDPLTGRCGGFGTGGTDATGGTGGTGGGGSGGMGGTGGSVFNCGIELTGGPLFDFRTSLFKPYNSLLPELTGTGDPATDCAVPDLSGNAGANLTGIDTKCLILSLPDVSGCMQFEETGSGDFDVTGEQTLSFVIDVTVASVGARVIITTDSVTTFAGTGTGALPGTITLDDLGGGFNINAAATGNVNCQATNTVTGDDVSAGICPLANLMGGDNSVPLPGDPGTRTFPDLTVTDTDFELGGGSANADGWYLVNPAPLAGNGTQWAALSGVRLN